jgi:predicted NUDIX family NTP pyrophosphohydrolase
LTAVTRHSAGVLAYRGRGNSLEVLLVHPGGPFWRRKDEGAWSIPKGECADGEPAEMAARREFGEETGWRLDGDLVPLGETRQAGGKTVVGFAIEADFDAATLVSNTFEMEWPPRSGRRQSFPEIDRAAWFDLVEARMKIIPGQIALLDRLAAALDGAGPIDPGR